MESNEGIKHDNEKLPWALLPFDALEEVVRALQHGAAEYGDRNWEKGMNWSRLLSATFRHLVAFATGKITDPETGLYHLAQAICNLLFLLAYVKRGVGTDDVTPVLTRIGQYPPGINGVWSDKWLPGSKHQRL